MSKRTAEQTEGEQLDLIDVEPENKEAILRVAHRYKNAKKERMAALAIEKAEKEKLLAVVKEAKILPDPDGSYRFTLDGLTITVTPRDELLKVKFAGDDDDDE